MTSLLANVADDALAQLLWVHDGSGWECRNVFLSHASQLLMERSCFSLHGTARPEMAPPPARPEAG